MLSLTFSKVVWLFGESEGASTPPQPGTALLLARILAPLCCSKPFRALFNAITFSSYVFDPKHRRKLTEGNQQFNWLMWQFISKSAYTWVWTIKKLASGKNIYRSLFPALELEKIILLN